MAAEPKPWQAEWDALREYETKLKEGFADPYGADNWEYERLKKSDPEHERLFEAFLAARRVQR